MKRGTMCLLTIVGVLLIAEAAPAWTVRRYYRPVWGAPGPVVVAQQPVVWGPQPVVWGPRRVYQPTTVVTTRNRPILGGQVTRARRAYRPVGWW
jgi:hypothetical protein